ncbi:MAG: D-aminoacylase [Candidatus Bathyarchaeota archaeon]|nr:MAG: D-aminoacylase [Candidatus Bathyarchaeota archaeon]
MYDLTIINGRILDGAGNPWYRADIGVKEGKICKIGQISSPGKKDIDAKGLIIAPGFIDVHSHSDETLLLNPQAESYVMQGITTAVNGNCGSSPAPLIGRFREEYIKRKHKMLKAGLDVTWTSFSDYCKTLDTRGIAINAVTLVGHGNIRVGIMGEDGYTSRFPSEMELEEMKALLMQSLEEGAFGLSAGLVYPPGVYAQTQELIELCKILPMYNAIFTIHIRGQGDQFLSATREAIDIGEASGTPVLLSHHSPNPGMWGNTRTSLRWVDEARAKGIDISLDKHGYVYGSTGLGTVLPPWAHKGGIMKLLERLKDPENRERLKRDIAGAREWPRVSPALHARAGDWEKITIISSLKKEYEGKSIKTISETKGIDPFETVFDVLIENEGTASVKYPAYSEGDLMRVFTHPSSMISTDGSASKPGIGNPHPKSYGTFPMIFRKYVRDLGILTLEEAVRKMTSQAAHRFGIWDRGLLAPSMWADIVIFDANKIADHATIDDPTKYPVGICYVIVNGELVLEKSQYTGNLPGKTLQKASSRIHSS